MKKRKIKLKSIINILLITFIIIVTLVLSLLIAFKFYMTSMKDDIIDLNLKSLKSGSSSKVYFWS